LEILGIDNTAPGQQPQLTFQVDLDGEPIDVLNEPIDRLRMMLAGPNTDFAGYWLESIDSALECEDPPVAPCIERDGSDLIFHAETSIPLDAVGSYTVGMEGRVVIDEARYAAMNPLLAFAVTDGDATPRREVVSQDKCNSCHQDL